MTDRLLPSKISDVELAFPATGLDYMPPMEAIPDKFKRAVYGDTRPWIDLARTWFYDGLTDRFSFVPAQGIDPTDAWRTLQVILGCRASQHQHKEACVAYLASLWMKAVVYGRKDCADTELRTIGDFPLQAYLAANPR